MVRALVIALAIIGMINIAAFVWQEIVLAIAVEEALERCYRPVPPEPLRTDAL